ncbi:MAG: VCBS repeat-containing protein, partial [bacterium]|nr:VCBS repeat-containing protein [bacterium]
PLINLTEKPIQADSAYELFTEAMRSDERFLVFDEADIKSAAIKAGIAPSDIARKQTLAAINTILEAHNFLQLTLRADADNILAQALLLDAGGEETGSVQELVREYSDLQQQVSPEKVPATSQAETPVPAQSESEPVRYASWTSETLRMRAYKIAVGDLTGDGKNEVIVATRTDLDLFEHAVLGEKDSFRPLTKIRGYNDAQILAVGIADINGNGREEIFLTTLRSVSAEVRVFEFNSGKFEEIWKAKGIAMRIIRSPEGKKTLVGQKTTASISLDFLSGKISEYAWTGDDYARQHALRVPGRVKIFGFTLADLDRNGKHAVLFYDKFDRIDVFRDGERIWRSRRSEAYRIPMLRKDEDERDERRIPGRIELATLGAEQAMHLILFENLSPFRFIKGLPLYNKSRLHVLRWTGETFARDFQSEDSGGYIVDYAVADVDNDGQQEVALAMVLKGDDLFKTPQSRIMVYELESAH